MVVPADIVPALWLPQDQSLSLSAQVARVSLLEAHWGTRAVQVVIQSSQLLPQQAAVQVAAMTKMAAQAVRVAARVVNAPLQHQPEVRATHLQPLLLKEIAAVPAPPDVRCVTAQAAVAQPRRVQPMQAMLVAQAAQVRQALLRARQSSMQLVAVAAQVAVRVRAAQAAHQVSAVQEAVLVAQAAQVPQTPVAVVAQAEARLPVVRVVRAW